MSVQYSSGLYAIKIADYKMIKQTIASEEKL